MGSVSTPAHWNRMSACIQNLVIDMPAWLGTPDGLMLCRAVIMLSNQVCSNIQVLFQVLQLLAGEHLNCSLIHMLQCKLLRGCCCLSITADLCCTVHRQRIVLAMGSCCVTPVSVNSHRDIMLSCKSQTKYCKVWCKRGTLPTSSHQV